MSKEDNIPSQEKGAQTDTSARVNFETEEQALAHFQIAKNRLFDISGWESLCGKGSANFTLTDAGGNSCHRRPEPGDHIRIDIPGPGSDTGDGNDWVRIEKVDDQTGPASEYAAMLVRPASNPGNAQTDTAHFFDDDATSTFLVERKGTEIRAEVHGRNELPNLTADSLMDKIRNAFVALGAMAGISHPQWRSLVKGLVQKN